MDKVKGKIEPTDPEDKKSPPEIEDAVILLNNEKLYHLVDPFDEGSMNPDQPEIEARLKELGILRKVGNRYIVDKEGFFIAFKLWANGKGEITPQEYAYSIFLNHHQTKKKRSEVDCIYYRSALGTIIFRTTLKPKPEGVKLHRQPRGYLKTTAKYVGKATDEPTLFSFPEVKQETGGNLVREVISRNTAILGNYLLQLWQESGEEELTIGNLSPIAEIMGNSNYEIKIYLLYLGGYMYPIVTGKKGGGLTLTTEQLFKISFNYSKEVGDRYRAGNYTEIIGSELTKFIKNEPVDSITVKPSPLFIKALEGKGLGNVLVVNDNFVKLALSLTDIAYKILSYSASNKPHQKIAEDNLVKHLGLEKQLKTQGRPRVRATILKGLDELQNKGHIKSYSYEEATGMYMFTYSDKYIKHKELKEPKGEK
jgi:hypothetical protein